MEREALKKQEIEQKGENEKRKSPYEKNWS